MLDLTQVVTESDSEPAAGDGARLTRLLEESQQSLLTIAHRGFNHWILTFSGGKDSTTTVILALETALQEHLELERIDVVYADTLVEIPVIQSYALRFLEFLKEFDRLQSLPLHFHVVRPPLEERFWVCLLGKGYPPPHQQFRWCTKRLKIEPVEKHLADVICPKRTALITGVRFGESAARDRRLSASCRRGGECGQGVWFHYSSRLQAAYLAPIVSWKECDVWDFLAFWVPSRGYPVYLLEKEVYHGRDTRFGCWMCTVVRQDKTMEKLVAQPEWAHLRPLMEFRTRVLQLTSHPASRERRPDGTPGRLSLETRKQLLDELLRLQEALHTPLVEEEEVEFIKALWSDKRYGSYEEARG
jgi:DNA sulfur modification protein DndC